MRFGKNDQEHKYGLFIREGIDNEIMEFYSRSKTAPVIGSIEFTKNLFKTHLKDKEINREISDRKIVKSINVPSIIDEM